MIDPPPEPDGPGRAGYRSFFRPAIRVIRRAGPRRLLVWLSLLIISWVMQPVLWSPLDQRFYSFFHSYSRVPEWTEVAVVGIDAATRDSLFAPPIFPLSRHVEYHALLLERLHEAGTRSAVLDLALRFVDFAEPPGVLADAMRKHGDVYLVMSMQEVRHRTPSGTVVSLTGMMPDSVLVASAKGVHVVDVQLDPDGVLRRFRPDPRLERLGLSSLPEHLSGQRVRRPVPIIFPSLDQPLPVVSYRDVIAGDPAVLDALRGRIAMIGLIEDPTIDFIAAPRLQDQGDGWFTAGLHGVIALSAITETLLSGAPMRDAAPSLTIGWIVLWAFLIMALPPRRHPMRAGMITFAVFILAMAATGVLHARLGLIFPAGLLAGTLFICGVQGMLVSYVESTRDLRIERLEADLMRRELLTARRTQERFLPRKVPEVAGLDLWGVNLSSAAVSGDYYDIIDAGPPGPLVLAIADVAGKGLPAALLMSNVQAGLHSHLMQGSFDLETTVRNLNRLVHENVDPGAFVTLLLAGIDRTTRLLRYVRAGHDEPILVRSDGTVSKLEPGGVFLGFLPAVSYTAEEEQLVPGDILCLYTDGVTEARSPADEEFGVERLIGVLLEKRRESAASIGAALLAAVEAFSGLQRQADDVTVVLLKVEAPPSAVL